jgi:hypothetical protein
MLSAANVSPDEGIPTSITLRFVLAALLPLAGHPKYEKLENG